MLDCNTYVIRDKIGVIIDPGSPQFLPALVKNLREDGIDPEDIDIIANTHLHGDHCGANQAFKQLSGARITVHPAQQRSYDIAVIQTARFFGFSPLDFKADDCFEDNLLKAGSMEFELIHSPGHSPDSICYYCPGDRVLLCGDVVFAQNTGRVDLPGGNADELRQSIEELSKLDIEYLLPGHMNVVIGATEVAHNFEFIKENVLRWL